MTVDPKIHYCQHEYPRSACQRCRTTCEFCAGPAETRIELHDEAAPSTGLTWYERLLCAGHRDELVDEIATGVLLGVTIEHMTNVDDGQSTACERVS